MESKYTMKNIGMISQLKDKFFAKDALGLTGMEISINRQPAGTGVPFVHIHQQNEEVYIVVSGTGIFFVDSKELPLTAGSLIRVAPGAERSLSAGSEEDLCYICVQAKAGSLEQFTMSDAKLAPTKTSWIN